MFGIILNELWPERLPFWAPVVIVPLNRGRGLLETDIIEAGKRGAADVFDSVIWDQKLLLLEQEDTAGVLERGSNRGDNRQVMFSANLPPHEDIVTVVQFFIVKVIWVEAFGVFVKSLKLTLWRGDSI